MLLIRSPFKSIFSALVILAAILWSASGSWGDSHYTIPPPRVVIAVDRDVMTYDPLRLTNDIDALANSAAYEGLVRLGSNGRIEPSLANSWRISADGTKLTFEIRKNVRFHDGSSLNAQVVADNFARGIRARLIPYGVFKSLRVVSEFALELVLNEPRPSLLVELTATNFSVVSGRVFERNVAVLGREPVGTGPFNLKQHLRGEFVSLRKFDNYWRRDPVINGVVLVTVPSLEVRVQMLREGRVQVALPISPELAASLRASGYATRVSDVINTVWLQFNPKTFSDARVRSSLGHALNREDMNQSLYGGFAMPATKGLVPQRIIGFDEILVPSYNVQRAKQLLAESGFSKRELRLLTAPTLQPIAVMVSQQIAALGIKVTIQVVESAATLALAARAGEADLWLNGLRFGPQFGRLLDQVLLPGGEMNWTGLTDPEVERLLTKKYLTYDSQVAAYKSAQGIVIRDKGLLYPLLHIGAIYAVRPEVRNFSIGPNGFADLSVVSVGR